MSRYIDAEKIPYTDISDIGLCYVAFKERIDRIPTANVEEVRHGEWETEEDEYQICATEFTCSVCGETYSSCELTDKQFIEMMKYCPNCGAKMDKEKE